MVTKAISMGIAFLFIVSGLMIFTNPVSETQATTSGDVYSGSGDWAVTTWTDYVGETLTVYGNVTITGRLNLTNTLLTLDQPSSMERHILITTGGSLAMAGASWIGTTNKTPGKYNAELKVNGGAYIYGDYATFDGIWFNINSAMTYFVNCYFYSCGIWNNYGLGYETDEPLDTGPLIISGCHFLNINTTDQTYISVIVTGNSLLVENCVFSNITLASGAPDSCSIIRSKAQNHVTIRGNEFPDSRFGAVFFQSAGGFTMHDNLIDGNTWLGTGGTYALMGYGAYLKTGSPVSNCTFSHNTFGPIRNGSKGICIEASDWLVHGNIFNNVDASGIAIAGATNGIMISPPGESLFDGNVVNNIRGPAIDTGAGAYGIMSQSAGGFTITNSVMRNISFLGCGISVVDPLVFDVLPGILIHANTFIKMTNASGAIAIFGGEDATVSWNNISIVDGPSVGIMFDSTAHNGTAHNNSVTGMYDSPNVGFPDGWQIVVGAYTYYAGGAVYGPKYVDNHASGGTMAHPDYNITGEKLGGGWWPNARMLVDTSEESIIHYQNANVTLRHDSQMLGVLKDGATQTMRFYNNGTSWAWFNKTDLDHHFVNTTPSNVYLAVNPAGQAINASYLGVFDGVITFRLNGSGSAIANITVTGLEPGNRYYVSIDGVPVLRLMASGSGTIIFDYSGPWSEHEFEVTPGIYGRTIVQLGAIIGIMMMLGILVSVIVPVVQIAQEKRKFKVDDLINMVIYIAVSVSLIGLVYALLP